MPHYYGYLYAKLIAMVIYIQVRNTRIKIKTLFGIKKYLRISKNGDRETMPANLRIFVSSTCADLFQERRDIADGLLVLNHEVILSEMPEKMPVHPHLSTVETCLEAIEKHADLVILVVSGRYGSSDEEGRSITMREFVAAKEAGLPILAFVRQAIWDLKPVWKRNRDGDFRPHVEDNRVFQLIEMVESQRRGNWIFPFFEAKDIVNIISYQLSCLFRDYLSLERRKRRELYFSYVNQYNVMFRQDGTCYRTAQYCLINNTSEVISSYLCGDTMDRPMSLDEFGLAVRDEHGDKLRYEMSVNTDNYKRWDLFFKNPLLPGESVRFYTQYISCDQGQYQGQHTRHVKEGIITYVFPKEFVVGEITIEVRDQYGWRDSETASIFESSFCRVVTIPYGVVEGVSQFRIKW